MIWDGLKWSHCCRSVAFNAYVFIVSHTYCYLLQRYTNSSSSRVKNDSKSCPPVNSKTRPIVLPNKATRTAKIIKPQVGATNVNKVFTLNKGLSLESLKKILGSGSGDSVSALNSLSSNNSNGRNSDADAVKWLETQGLSMSDGESIVDSALDSGRSLHLTEGGKLTLNWVKNQNVNPSSSSTVTPKKIILNSTGKTGTPIILVSSASATPNQLESQKLLTSGTTGNNYSRKQGQILQTPTQTIKITKPVTIATIPSKNLQQTTNRNSIANSNRNPKQTLVNEKLSIDLEEEEDDDAETLRKTLEDERKQFRIQLAEKDREIERLKKLLADQTSKTLPCKK